MVDKNIVYIGDKGFFNYIVACKKQLGEKNKVTIKARGKHISRAVDVLEYLKREEGRKCKKISTETEDFENKEGKQVHVSGINIEVE